jgi:error-prone DNA polymerase
MRNCAGLLTLGKGRAGKRKCDLGWQDVATHGQGLLAILVPDAADALAADLTGEQGEIAAMEAFCRRSS